MKIRNCLAWSGVALGFVGAGSVVNSFLPRTLGEKREKMPINQTLQRSDWPEIEVTFLRCGSVIIPEWLAMRGSFSFVPCELVHSTVLVRHPRGTFLYDSGLCADIELFLMDQSVIFDKTLGNFVLEQPLCEHLQQLDLEPGDIDFVVLSHLHWDHVSGIPDLPGVQLKINRVEYEVAHQGLMERNKGLVKRLLCNNPVELLDFAGPAYEGFRCSYDLFGDGSVILVPLPGHTAGQMGMFINRSNGTRLFLIADAAWISDNYLRPATMHPLLWSMVTHDSDTAKQTLLDLHYFAQQHPEIPMVAMHDAHMQEAFGKVERSKRVVQVEASS